MLRINRFRFSALPLSKLTSVLVALQLASPIAIRAAEAQKSDEQKPAASPLSPVNRLLPGWLRLSGEFRDRFGARTAYGFKTGVNDAYDLTRARLSLEIAPHEWVRGFIQVHDARASGIAPLRATSAVKDILDLRQGYVEFLAGCQTRVKLRVGRQELIFGKERLVGAPDWGNTARSFDAARLTLTHDKARVDVFASSVVNITTGGRFAGQLPKGFDYALEGARQGGHYASEDVAAWAGYSILGFTATQLPFKPRFSAEYDYATGDRSRTDGRISTFDQLYPTNHSYYGIADQVGWRNIKGLRTGVELRPRVKIKFTFDHHFFRLASAHDGLYNSSGALVVRPPAAGALSTDVGREIDVFMAWTPLPVVTVGSGFAHLFPGQFLIKNSPGSGTSFPYAFLTYKF